MRFEGAKRLSLTAAFRPRITAIAELRAMSWLLSTTRFPKHLAVVCRSLVAFRRFTVRVKASEVG